MEPADYAAFIFDTLTLASVSLACFFIGMSMAAYTLYMANRFPLEQFYLLLPQAEFGPADKLLMNLCTYVPPLFALYVLASDNKALADGVENKTPSPPDHFK